MISEQLILATSSKLFGERTLAGSALKLAEEVGEVCGAVNKLPEGRATHEELDAELGDVLIVLSQLAALRDTTLEELLERRWMEIVRRNQADVFVSTSDLTRVCAVCGQPQGEHASGGLRCPDPHIFGAYLKFCKFTPLTQDPTPV